MHESINECLLQSTHAYTRKMRPQDDPHKGVALATPVVRPGAELGNPEVNRILNTMPMCMPAEAHADIQTASRKHAK